MSLVMNSDMLKFSWYICMCNVISVLHVCMLNWFLSDEKIALICTVAKLQTRGMVLLTKAKRPLKFKMLCGFNKHAVKLRMHKAAPYAFPIPLNTF